MRRAKERPLLEQKKRKDVLIKNLVTIKLIEGKICTYICIHYM